MPSQKQIYLTETGQYEALVSREDYQGNIPRALDAIIQVDGLDVLDLGAGTGRLAGMLAPRVKSMRAFDLSAHMLGITRDKLCKSGLKNGLTAVADHRALPVASHSAHLVISGWSVSNLAVWNPDSWWDELEKWLNEMKRVLRPNSYIVLFESLGTGLSRPLSWINSRIIMHGWMNPVSKINGYAPIINSIRFNKPWRSPAFSLVTRWWRR